MSVNGLTKLQGEAAAWQKSAEGIVVGGNEPALPRAGEVYPEDSPRRRPERCPGRMTWVNGRGCQRACTDRPIAAKAIYFSVGAEGNRRCSACPLRIGERAAAP